MTSQLTDQALKLLTKESVEKLRTLDPIAVWKTPLEALVLNHDLTLETSNIYLDLTVSLNMPVGTNKKDKENTQEIYRALGPLSAVQARDERLWVSLALGEFRDYLMARWPESEPQKMAQHVENHVFAITTRNRFRDHAIARLWWIERFVRNTFPGTEHEGRSILLDLQQDFMSNLLGRPNLASVQDISTTISGLFHQDYVINGTQPDREKYRTFFKSIDIVAGRRVVTAMSTVDVQELVKAKYKEAAL